MSKKHTSENSTHASKSCSCNCNSMGLWAAFAVIFLVSAITLGYTVSMHSALKSGSGSVVAPGPTPSAGTAGGDTPPAPVQVTADDDAFLGPADAKITVIEFSDFQCPFCGAAAGTQADLIARFKSQDPSWEAAIPKLKELARQGKIKFVFRDFPLSSIHPMAQKASEAAECAKEQNKFWEYHDLLFERQDDLSIENFKVWASELKLDTSKFNECLDSGKMTAEVQKDFQAGQAVGVRGTPAFFVNGQLISGAQPWSAFEPLIAQAMG